MIKDLRYVMPQGQYGPQVLEALVLTDSGDYRWKTVRLAVPESITGGVKMTTKDEMPAEVWVSKGRYQLHVYNWAVDPLRRVNKFPRISYIRTDTVARLVEALDDIAMLTGDPIARDAAKQALAEWRKT